MDPQAVRPGQRYRLALDQIGELESFAFARTPIVEVQVEREANGELVATEVRRETDVELVGAGGTIERSLSACITGRGEHPSLVSFFVDVFAYDIDFHVDTHPGDTFRILVEKESIDGAFLRYRRVLAAEYRGKVGAHRAFWWQPPGGKKGRYVDDRGRGVAKTLLKTPLKYTRISSGFDRHRMHPILHREKGHYGVDYAAPRGTPVWASADGTITFRDRKGGAGNMIVLDHGGGLKTVYMHLDSFARGQKVGQRVAQKTVIGYVGSTGLSTGPHLHFGLKVGGRYVDPTEFEMQRGPGVPRKHMKGFRRERARLGARLEAISVGPAQAASEPASPADAAVPAVTDDRAETAP
jgi:murein DD-endopeptidase MepM/ murein hydrolase activator NlpD